jgi:hypothetical protein
MFLLPRARALDLRPANVRGLRVSLNSPVVACAELPMGPAHAALLILEEGAGLDVNVMVMSLKAGQVAVFHYEDPVAPDILETTIDTALSFAESMGFLFDDDLAGGADDVLQHLIAQWREALETGWAAGSAPGTGPAADDASRPTLELGDLMNPEELEKPEELQLTEILEDGWGEDEAPVFSPEPPQAAPGPSLSKFRDIRKSAAAAEADEGAQRPRAALGRLKLVRRANGPGERKNWLRRVLASL